MYNYKYKTRNVPSSALIILLVASLAIGGAILYSPAVEEPINEVHEPTISNGLMNYMFEHSDTMVKTLIYTWNYDYENVVNRINELGGTVSFEYQYARGIAAEMPRAAIIEISEMPEVERVELDEMREPASLDRETMAAMDFDIVESAFGIDASEFTALDLDAAEVQAIRAGMSPENYGNQLAHEVYPLWNEGNFGQDSLIVVIDTGIQADHSMFLPGQVIGGMDFTDDVGTEFEGATVSTNHWHGTHVAGTAAGNGVYCFGTSGIIPQAMMYNGYVLDTCEDFGLPDSSLIPLYGNAPDASLYAVKVFDHTGGSTPTSIIIAGIEHVIAMHESGEQDVDVVNMSLGGGTGYEGRDLESQVVDYGSSVGITFVVSAGNDGPASLTIGTPSGANTAITTGAAATPAHTRTFWDFNFGSLGIGEILYPTDDTQMIYFSSRGPTSDGREKPTASTVGVFVLSAFTGSTGALGFASGTSMASPNLAGIVALLNTYGETVGASPYDYKQAVVAGSTPMPGYEDWEQGAGFVSAADSMDALEADTRYGSEERDLRRYHRYIAAEPYGEELFESRRGHHHSHREPRTETFSITDLTPGHVEHFWFKGSDTIESITMDVTNVELGVDPILFNSFEVNIMSPIRTTDTGYYFASTNVWGDATFEISDLNSTVSGNVFGVIAENLPMMDGYYRISIENDWTSFDNLSGDFSITITYDQDHYFSADEYHFGVTYTGDVDIFDVGFGTNGVMLELGWLRDWYFYPASDMELIVFWTDTDGVEYEVLDGATFSSPEIAIINADNIASVTVVVEGLETYGYWDAFKLRVTYL